MREIIHLTILGALIITMIVIMTLVCTDPASAWEVKNKSTLTTSAVVQSDNSVVYEEPEDMKLVKMEMVPTPTRAKRKELSPRVRHYGPNEGHGNAVWVGTRG